MADDSKNGTSDVQRTGRELGGPVERQHASALVFRRLAAAILHKDLEPGAPLPPERQLSDDFGVSRAIVREAIHRLMKYELVRVRQGSTTIVLDPDESTDIHLLGLEIDLMPDDPAELRSLAERQIYAGAALVDLAEQRISDEEIAALERLIADFLSLSEDEQTKAQFAFERAHWVGIARATRNRFYLRETQWIFNVMKRDERIRRAVMLGSPASRAEEYAALAVALRNRSGAVSVYLSSARRLS